MKKQKVLKVLGATALVGLTTLTMTSCNLKNWWNSSEKPEFSETTNSATSTLTPGQNEDVNKISGGVIVDGKVLGQNQEVNYIPKIITFSNVANRAVGSQSIIGAQVTINAKVVPDTAINKKLTWTLEWNEESWDDSNALALDCSKNKLSEYITIIPNDSNNHNVTITLNHLLSSDVILHVKSSNGIEKEINLYNVPVFGKNIVSLLHSPDSEYDYTKKQNTYSFNYLDGRGNYKFIDNILYDNVEIGTIQPQITLAGQEYDNNCQEKTNVIFNMFNSMNIDNNAFDYDYLAYSWDDGWNSEFINWCTNEKNIDFIKEYSYGLSYDSETIGDVNLNDITLWQEDTDLEYDEILIDGHEVYDFYHAAIPSIRYEFRHKNDAEIISLFEEYKNWYREEFNKQGYIYRMRTYCGYVNNGISYITSIVDFDYNYDFNINE